MFLKIFVFSGFWLLASCLVETGGGRGDLLHELNECYFNKDLRTGKAIKWADEDAFPISFYVHESVPDEAYFNFVTAVDHWNIRWAEYVEGRGGEAGPLLEILGKGEKFAASGSLLGDDYNMLVFVERSKIGKIMGKQSFHVDEIQGVTYSRKSRNFLGNISLKSADILVNKTSFKYYYDEEYNKDILAWKKSLDPKRRVAFTKIPSRTALIKNRILNFFLKFFDFFKTKKQRGLARLKKSIPENMVDFPSLMLHEPGHALGLGHVDEDKYQKRSAMRAPHRMPMRKPASLNEKKEGKEQSIMKVELPKGTVRRHISDFDLGNVFCGYYETP